MTYNNFIGDCCQALAIRKLAPLDADLYYLVELERISEQIATTFGYTSTHRSESQHTASSIQILVNSFKSRLDDLRASFPKDSSCMSETHTPVSFAKTFLIIY